jgi:hypothetical protein
MEMISCPPYCGVPRPSHQFPPVLVVDVVEGVVEVVFGAVEVVVVGCVVVCVVVLVVVVVVVDVLHEAKTSGITIRVVSAIQITPRFIFSSLISGKHLED